MSIAAGQLRHRVQIERLEVVQDPSTLEIAEVWHVWAIVWAAVVPLSGREFVAAQAQQAGVTTRITIRWRDGIEPTMRVRHQGLVHNVKAVLPDPTFRSHIALMCEAGVPAPAVPVTVGGALQTEEGEPIETEAGIGIELE